MIGVQDPQRAGVEPWQMLGFLQGVLERDGSISPEQWQEAIDSQRR